MPPREAGYTPVKGSLAYACLIELYLAGACPAGRREDGLKKDALAARVADGGLSETDPRERHTLRVQEGRFHVSVSNLDKTLTGLNKRKDQVVKCRKGCWQLLDEGQRIARRLCPRDGIPLPPFDAQHAQAQQQAPPQQQHQLQGQQQQPGRQQRRTQQRGQQPPQQQPLQQQPPQQQRPPPLTPECAAALRRQQQAQQVQQAQQAAAAAHQAAPEQVLLQPGGAQGGRRGGSSAAGCKRRASDAIDLTLSDGAEAGSIGTPPAARRQRQQPNDGEAGPARLHDQCRQLQELFGMSRGEAEQLLEMHDGDLDSAVDALLDTPAAPPGGVDGVGGAYSSGGRGQLPGAGAALAQDERGHTVMGGAARAAAAVTGDPAAVERAAAPRPQAAGVLSSGVAFDPSTAWPLRQQLAMPPVVPDHSFEDIYEVVLLLDNRERQGAQRGMDRMLSKLQDLKLCVERRQLPVGDALWVARIRGAGAGEEQEEYVLDFVVERKGSQDLMSSIKDGRYLAQKWRMLTCGLANRMYLVETSGDGQLGGMSRKSVQTARTSTQVVDGFTVLYSKDFDASRLRPNTIDWYANLTASISRRYAAQAGGPGASGRAASSVSRAAMTFKELAERVREEEQAALSGSAQWQLMLTAAAGISAGAAEAIAARYPSPSALLRCVRQQGPAAVAAQLSALQCPRIGGQALDSNRADALLQQLFPAEEQRIQQERYGAQGWQVQRQQQQLSPAEGQLVQRQPRAAQGRQVRQQLFPQEGRQVRPPPRVEVVELLSDSD